MTDITAGAFVTRKGGDGTQMLVTGITTGFSTKLPGPRLAQLSYHEDGGVTFATIPVDELELQVTDAERLAFVDAQAAADADLVRAEWKAEQDRLDAEDKANQAVIAAAIAAETAQFAAEQAAQAAA
jgi:hypothetical protein